MFKLSLHACTPRHGNHLNRWVHKTNAQLWKYLQYAARTPCSPPCWPVRFDGIRWWWVWSTTLNKRRGPRDGAHLKMVLVYTDGDHCGVGKWQTCSMNLPGCHERVLLHSASVQCLSVLVLSNICAVQTRQSERSRMWGLELANVGWIKSREMYFILFLYFSWSFVYIHGGVSVCFKTYILFIFGSLVWCELCTWDLHLLFCGIWDVYLGRAQRQCVCRCKQGILY